MPDARPTLFSIPVQRAFADALVPLTVSFGAVSFPVDGTTAETLIATADQALYLAKHGGRNRSERAISGSVWPPVLAQEA